MKLVLIIYFFLIGSFASADDRYFFVIEKQEKKKTNRWSLSEWIDQRDRLRMMDLWLALHSPAPYEFYVGAQANMGRRVDGDYSGGWDFFLVGYAYLFGIELSRELDRDLSQINTLFHLRLFGLHAQGTNIMLVGGMSQSERLGIKFWQPKLGATLTWYLYKSFGVEAGYYHLINKVDGPYNLSVNRWNLGGILDFSFVRLYGGYYQTSEFGSLALPRSGAYVGAKLFF